MRTITYLYIYMFKSQLYISTVQTHGQYSCVRRALHVNTMVSAYYQRFDETPEFGMWKFKFKSTDCAKKGELSHSRDKQLVRKASMHNLFSKAEGPHPGLTYALSTNQKSKETVRLPWIYLCCPDRGGLYNDFPSHVIAFDETGKAS